MRRLPRALGYDFLKSSRHARIRHEADARDRKDAAGSAWISFARARICALAVLGQLLLPVALDAHAQPKTPAPAADMTVLRDLASLGFTTAIAALKAKQDDILGEMAMRAIERSRLQTDEARVWLGFVPLLALLAVPFALWRAHAYRKARAKGLSAGRTAWRGAVATLTITALLWGFIQVFLFIENFKRNFSWTSPAQGLASNALVYFVEKGEKLVQDGSLVGRLVGETMAAIAAGKKSPEALLGHLFENAERFKDTRAFRMGYRLYTAIFPWLDYFGPALLVILFLVFLRFAMPGIREIMSHVSGDGPPGVGFFRSLLRHLRVEIFAMIVFLFPFLLVTTLSFFVTWIMTSVAAQGIIDNTLNALTLFYSGNVEPELVTANFVGIVAFVFETVLLLLVANAILLANWMSVLHEKFRTRRSFWTYRRFVPHFLRSTFRLYLTLLVPSLVLAAALDYLADAPEALGGTVTMLLPLGLCVALNLLLWLLRFFGGLRRALDSSRWLPEATGAPPA
jgi:hypothetical protein